MADDLRIFAVSNFLHITSPISPLADSPSEFGEKSGSDGLFLYGFLLLIEEASSAFAESIKSSWLISQNQAYKF